MRTVYTVDELTGRARERALAKLAEWATHEDWREDVYEDAISLFAHLGIEARKLKFSGFWSQGDGASFEGTWKADRVNYAVLAANMPKDSKLLAIGLALQAFALEFPLAEVIITRSNQCYSHSGTMTIDVYPEGDDSETGSIDDSPAEQLMRDAADWLYARLEAEHAYLTDEAQLIENAQANGYEFEEDGSIA